MHIFTAGKLKANISLDKLEKNVFTNITKAATQHIKRQNWSKMVKNTHKLFPCITGFQTTIRGHFYSYFHFRKNMSFG